MLISRNFSGKEEIDLKKNNTVIAGDYLGADVTLTSGKAILAISLGNMIILNKKTVAHHEISSETSGKHTVSITFSDGKKSLVEMDDKIFKVFLTQLF